MYEKHKQPDTTASQDGTRIKQLGAIKDRALILARQIKVMDEKTQRKDGMWVIPRKSQDFILYSGSTCGTSLSTRLKTQRRKVASDLKKAVALFNAVKAAADDVDVEQEMPPLPEFSEPDESGGNIPLPMPDESAVVPDSHEGADKVADEAADKVANEVEELLHEVLKSHKPTVK